MKSSLVKLTFSALLVLGLVACNEETSFKSSTSANTPTSASDAGGGDGAKGTFTGQGNQTPRGGQNSGDSNPDISINTDEANGAGGIDTGAVNDGNGIVTSEGHACPKGMQEVLILDMKSGWWAGDAGDFFKTLLGDINTACGQKFTFEFHHLMSNENTYQVFPGGQPGVASVTDVEKVALKADWSQYHQIWILSGSHGDELDMRTSAPVFAAITAKIKASGTSLFIGSGNGNLTHANAFAEGLGLDTRFATDLPEGPVVPATLKFNVVSRLNLGAELSTHGLFAGIKSIADTVDIQNPFGGGGITLKSDYLQPGAEFAVVGKNSQGKPGIAVRQAGTKIVLDTGLQRFYPIKSGEKETLRYLENIAVYLVKK